MASQLIFSAPRRCAVTTWNCCATAALTNALERSEVQAGDVYHVKIFGDSAYKVRSHMRSYYKVKDLKDVLTDDEYATWKDWNYKMKTDRITIEWNYGVTAKLFRYIQNTDQL